MGCCHDEAGRMNIKRVKVVDSASVVGGNWVGRFDEVRKNASELFFSLAEASHFIPNNTWHDVCVDDCTLGCATGHDEVLGLGSCCGPAVFSQWVCHSFSTESTESTLWREHLPPAFCFSLLHKFFPRSNLICLFRWRPHLSQVCLQSARRRVWALCRGLQTRQERLCCCQVPPRTMWVNSITPMKNGETISTISSAKEKY